MPKLDIRVLGRGGSRRAGEQDAAKRALDAAREASAKTQGGGKRPRRATQLKLLGIATVQSDAPAPKPESKN